MFKKLFTGFLFFIYKGYLTVVTLIAKVLNLRDIDITIITLLSAYLINTKKEHKVYHHIVKLHLIHWRMLNIKYERVNTEKLIIKYLTPCKEIIQENKKYILLNKNIKPLLISFSNDYELFGEILKILKEADLIRANKIIHIDNEPVSQISDIINMMLYIWIKQYGLDIIIDTTHQLGYIMKQVDDEITIYRDTNIPIFCFKLTELNEKYDEK